MTQFYDFLANRLPEQDQGCLSFCDHQPRAFKAWVDALPMINIGESAKLLYRATLELSHLQIAPNQRFQLLEMLRSKVHYINEALKTHYDKHPIVLSPKAKKVANLSQSLQKNLALNYKICLVDSLSSQSKILNSSREFIPPSLHRFISELCFVLLRSYQLYLPAMPNIWLELHLAYALAEDKGLLDFSIEDDIMDGNLPHCIGAVYKKAIILASAQPNQLHPQDLQDIFYLSNDWQSMVSITAESTTKSLYALILNTDAPPRYIRDIQNQHHYLRFVSMESLTKHIEHTVQDGSEVTRRPTQKTSGTMSKMLANHLTSTWRTANKRNNERLPKTCAVKAYLGFSACYAHLNALSQSKANTPSNESCSPTSKTAENNYLGQTKQEHDCQMVNLSHGGTCLAWFQAAPKQLTNGNLICLKDEGSTRWRIGIVRWIRHFQGEGIRTGIEFFPPNSQAITLKIQLSANPDHPHPVILLPPATNGAKPTLLLNVDTPATRSYGLLDYAGEHKVSLEEVLRQTTNFKEIAINPEQALFENIGQKSEKNPVIEPVKSGTSEEDDLDSLWAEL